MLDVTRLMSRLGRGPLTGVDRVEAAWLDYLCKDGAPVFGLARTHAGCLLLDRRGLAGLQRLIAGAGSDLPPADLLSRLTVRGDATRARAETALRRLSLARAPVLWLPRLLRRHLPAGFVLLNTGHANLSHRMMRAARRGGAARIAVLIHDTIPLDHPEFTRPDIPPVFARKLAVIAAHADLVIHTAAATRARNEAQLSRLGPLPAGVTAPLGLNPVLPDRAAPRPIPPSRPYFVTIGTIEPRKNHGFLLDLWDRILAGAQGEVPALLILGARGWSNAPVFRRLDDPGARRGHVFELPGLTDGQVAGLLAGSKGLLFPSHVEGFGLPPLEAAALGVPVVLPHLPIYHETLGDYPIYRETTDVYAWAEAIGMLTQGIPGEVAQRAQAIAPPDWEMHCKTVLRAIG
ncbi:glycosyltransferase [Szabonella alba]|uniref:glycosyltransferase n=1 Tax=Szabonella alba TaxID=2804194 RepID=UPI001F2A4621|nr:glycosyltransferase [Szabonella alba]